MSMPAYSIRDFKYRATGVRLLSCTCESVVSCIPHNCVWIPSSARATLCRKHHGPLCLRRTDNTSKDNVVEWCGCQHVRRVDDVSSLYDQKHRPYFSLSYSTFIPRTTALASPYTRSSLTLVPNLASQGMKNSIPRYSTTLAPPMSAKSSMLRGA